MKRDGVLGIASDLVDYDPAIRTAVEHALGQTIVVRDLEGGLALPHLHPRCTIFVISSLDEDPTLVKAVQLMRDRNYEVVFLTPALLDIERDLVVGHVSIRSQMIQQERDSLISELRARGAVVMDWDYKQPLYRVLDKGGVAG